jgi:hypothetical protein
VTISRQSNALDARKKQAISKDGFKRNKRLEQILANKAHLNDQEKAAKRAIQEATLNF